MKRLYSLFLTLGLVVIIGILTFWLGRKTAKPTYETLISNTTFVKQIAELSTLEVHGNATFKSSNVKNDGTFSDAMKRMFLESTMHLNIPYTAKYGVSLEGQDVSVDDKDSIVTIHLPEPKLLSFELNLGSADADTKKGWFQSRSDADYLSSEKKLYDQSKAQLANNATYKQQCKDKISKLLTDYYEPMHYKVVVDFGGVDLTSGDTKK